MSSIIFSETVPFGSDTYDRRFAVNVNRKPGETLGQYVKRIREGRDMSLTDVERASAVKGNKIAGSYVSRIENGIQDPEGISPKKLQGLAFGLDVSLDELIAIVLNRPIEDADFNRSEFFLMYQDAKNLNPQKKRDFKIAWQMAKDAMRRIKNEGS